MLGQISKRDSKVAWYSRRVGAIALPSLIISIIFHRFEVIETQDFLILLGVVSFLAVAGLSLAVWGVRDIWNEGGRGSFNVILAFIYNLICLLPFLWGVFGLYSYPQLNDISTDLRDPPALTERQMVEAPFDEGKATLLKQFYPDIVPRRFRISPHVLFKASMEVAEAQNWSIRYEVPPDVGVQDGYALIDLFTPIMGFNDQVAIRIRPDPFGAVLDIRSASTIGQHDIGSNAKRIRGFFDALDTQLLQVFGGEVFAFPEEVMERLNEEEGFLETLLPGVDVTLKAPDSIDRMPIPAQKPPN
ncbi:DUF1499 domain-containing protein [Flexibacterium corallicola]|uniref:DUF1499 domain-containing protein n=1 Tax=Flexibacterium corallicola TaxID=3037259 RepID=UPI00286EFF4C|nr:DUF1499 domain-containing protein [Pseudovibrio sp. M1P-2-3]